ncbi:MAG: hypothetical protein WCC57_16225 [Paracoccaceae bacterium]
MKTNLILAITALVALASCGADGAPTAPTTEPGVSISGQARIGVVGST